MEQAIEAAVTARRAELIASASMEIAPRERAGIEQVAEALPVNTCIYVPSPTKRPLAETLAAIGAVYRANLDPVPHIAARRFASRAELTDFLAAVSEHGAHRAMLIAGDDADAKGPYADTLQVLEDGVLAGSAIREIGIAGYPEGHARVSHEALHSAFSRKRALAEAQG